MKLAIIGTVGVPGRYGGFETLAENLVRYAQTHAEPDDTLTVYCSARSYPERAPWFLGAQLRYSRLDANGAQSVLYDAITSLGAIWRGHDQLLLLGVSGAVAIPLIRLLSRARIVTNVDGIEWRRDKWQGFARRFLRWSEALAVRYSHVVVADNKGIADYLYRTYGIEAEVIAYGGDHALVADGGTTASNIALPENYALALCRIEPENNVDMILEAFDDARTPLVFVGNWSSSAYGRRLRSRYQNHIGLYLLDPVYETEALFALRQGAHVYVHGHSAGGTNPSLVEMMHFGKSVIAFDCVFNRYTTEEKAAYFSGSNSLTVLLTNPGAFDNGSFMKEIAERRYRWDAIGEEYFNILRNKR